LDLAQAIGERIRSLRNARGLSQMQLSERSGIHVKLLARIETGRHGNLTVRTLERLARGLSMPVHDLVRIQADGRANAEVSAVLALLRGVDKATRSAAVAVVRSIVRLARRRPAESETV
jgi:XRE family transcriptional regulator, regulator of sulfur utilization